MRLIAMLLAFSLMLTGCNWMTGAYSSIRPHTQSYSPANRDTPSSTATTFLELRSAVCDLIDDGQERGLILLEDYDLQNLQTDVLSVVEYALESYPLGCYALEDLLWELGSSGSDPVLHLTLSYRINRNTISSIQKARTSSAARPLIHQAMAACEALLVFQVGSYSDTDFLQIVRDYAQKNADIVMEMPQVILSTYPEEGTRRLVEMKFSYQNSREQLRAMQQDVQQVTQSAMWYLLPNHTPMEHYAQLYTFLMERFEYRLESSITPAYSLLLDGIGDSNAFASVYHMLCQKAGLYSQIVSGKRNGENWYWNLIYDGEQYYHVDLLSSGEFLPLEDWKLEAYAWNRSSYPASIPESLQQTQN